MHVSCISSHVDVGLKGCSHCGRRQRTAVDGRSENAALRFVHTECGDTRRQAAPYGAARYVSAMQCMRQRTRAPRTQRTGSGVNEPLCELAS